MNTNKHEWGNKKLFVLIRVDWRRIFRELEGE
jgi:hypothetical protein